MISKTQVQRMTHMLGLNYSRKPYRNYFNSGQDKDEALEDLVARGLAKSYYHDAGGGWYYFLNENGLEFVLRNPETFNYDRRLRTHTGSSLMKRYEL